MVAINNVPLFILCHIANPVLGFSFLLLIAGLYMSVGLLGFSSTIIEILFVSLGMLIYGGTAQPYNKTYTSALNYYNCGLDKDYGYYSFRSGIRAGKWLKRLEVWFPWIKPGE